MPALLVYTKCNQGKQVNFQWDHNSFNFNLLRQLSGIQD